MIWITFTYVNLPFLDYYLSDNNTRKEVIALEFIGPFVCEQFQDVHFQRNNKLQSYSEV